MAGYVAYYLTNMKIAVLQQFQYRVGNYFYMIGMVAEPVIYLVVWSTIARTHGGSVAGISAGGFAAYYIVWTLVRNMNIVFTPFGWEWRVQYGQFSSMLLRPQHPIHEDISYFAGWKIVVIVLWLPLAAVLSLIFHPTLHPTLLQGIVFFVAIWGAYLIRTVMLWLLGLVTFWTTRVSAIFQVYFAAELLLSGRLVPMQIMPGWVQTAANILPFQWTFYFPIEALVGSMSVPELLRGVAMQVLWVVIGTAGIAVFWPVTVRKYSAVGN